MRRIYLQIFIVFVIACSAALISFIYLNAREEVTPGWADPIVIQEKGAFPSLIFHEGEFWLAFIKGGDKGSEIAVMRSENGVEWSPPYTLVKASEDLTSPFNPQWLKRPNGDLWLVWDASRGAHETYMELVYYTGLNEDGTFSAPSVIHSFDGSDYSFSSVTNTPDGGLAMLEAFYPPVYLTIQGREVEGTVYTKCVVQSTDETLEWSQPFLLSQTDFAVCVAILLDNQGTLWAVYEESDPVEGTYFRTSHDGITWSEPHMTPVVFGERFFQRHDHQYVLFFIYDTASVYMMSSPDGTEWCNPTPVINLEKAIDLDVTESDDGTLWMIAEGRRWFYITHFSDEQYTKDSQEMRDFRMKNGVVACGIAIIVCAAWLFLKRRYEKTDESREK